MNHFQAELKYFFRNPLIWLLVAFLCLFFSWGFLLLVELFQVNQLQFAGMSEAPSVVENVVFQGFQWQVKLLIFMVSLVGGLSYSRLHQNHFISFYLKSQQPNFIWMRDKFLAGILILSLFALPVLLQLLYVFFKVESLNNQLIWAVFGWLLLTVWMLSLSQALSAFFHNSGFAILFNLIVLGLLWFIGFSSFDGSWGKNWIQTLSPSYHFQQFLSADLPLASLFYFVAGTVVNMALLLLILRTKRLSL